MLQCHDIITTWMCHEIMVEIVGRNTWHSVTKTHTATEVASHCLENEWLMAGVWLAYEFWVQLWNSTPHLSFEEVEMGQNIPQNTVLLEPMKFPCKLLNQHHMHISFPFSMQMLLHIKTEKFFDWLWPLLHPEPPEQEETIVTWHKLVVWHVGNIVHREKRNQCSVRSDSLMSWLSCKLLIEMWKILQFCALPWSRT